MEQQQSTMVCVRLRPPSAKESAIRCIKEDGEKALQFTNPDKSYSLYSYDKVFGEGESQGDVFQHCKHIISSVLSGFNGTIMAYGQTGSGKTHSLIGSIDGEERGLVPRAVEALGEGIEADTSGAEFEVRLSVVEIYCERIRDLLDPSRDNLQVKQDAAGAIFVEGALEAQVGGEDQLVAIMHQGLAARTVAATCMNATSSRSHCIVTVTVEKTCPDGSVLVGKLKMVDLAGSERQDKTLAAGQTLVEGSQINKSLSALANVIYALTDSGSSSSSGPDAGGPGGEAAGNSSSSGGGSSNGSNGKHVPFRDSKLTRVLQDSLGGTSRTMLIICCSPCYENGAETLSSLRFGSRARGLKNSVAVNVRLSAEVLQQQLEKAKAQIKELQQQLAAEQQRTASLAPTPQGATACNSSRSSSPTSCSFLTACTAPAGLAAGNIMSPQSTSGCGANATGAGVNSAKGGFGHGSQGDSEASSSSSSSGEGSGVGAGSLGSKLLSRQVPWWQHVLITGLSVVTTAVYVSWERSLLSAAR